MQLQVQRPGRENIGRIHKTYKNEAIINKKCLDNIKKRNQELNKIRMQIFDSREYKRLVFQQLRNDTLQHEKMQEQQYQTVEKQYNNYRRTNEIKYPQNKNETAQHLKESREMNEYLDNGIQGNYPEYEIRQDAVLQQEAREQEEMAQQLRQSYWTMSSPIPNIHAQKMDFSSTSSPNVQKKILKIQTPKSKSTPKKQVQIQLTNSQEQKNSPELKNGSHTASLFSKESYKDESDSLRLRPETSSHKDDDLRFEDFLESPDQDTNTAIKTKLRENQSIPMQTQKSVNEIFQLDEDHLFSDDINTIHKANEYQGGQNDLDKNISNQQPLIIPIPVPHTPESQQMKQNIQEYISEQNKSTKAENNKMEMTQEQYEMQQMHRFVQDTLKSFEDQQRLSGNQMMKSGLISNQPVSGNNFVNTVEFIPKQEYPSMIINQLQDRQSVEYIAKHQEQTQPDEPIEDCEDDDVSVYDSRQFPYEQDSIKQSILDQILAEHSRVRQAHDQQEKARQESELLKYQILKSFNIKKPQPKPTKSGFIPQKQYTNHFAKPITKSAESAPLKTQKQVALSTRNRSQNIDKVSQLQQQYLQQQYQIMQ